MRWAAFIAVLAIAACGVGCSSSDDESQTPVTCLQGPDHYLRALEAAPGTVELDGTTLISECFVPDQSAGDLATVGQSVVAAATQLNADARRSPGSPAALRLGYLVGAVQRGVSESGGIHADLARRLETAAQFTGHGRPPASFQRAYGKGFAAGLADG